MSNPVPKFNTLPTLALLKKPLKLEQRCTKICSKKEKNKNVKFWVYLLFKIGSLNVFSPDVSCSCMFQMFVY